MKYLDDLDFLGRKHMHKSLPEEKNYYLVQCISNFDLRVYAEMDVWDPKFSKTINFVYYTTCLNIGFISILI